MLYISKVEFKALPKRLRKDDPNEEHKFVMSLFPNLNLENPRQDFGILFRREQLKYKRHYLIQSSTEPSLENMNLVDNDDFLRQTTIQTKEVSSIYENILLQEDFSYKIRVNTTMSSQGKRIPVRGEKNIHDWWVLKASSLGFIIDGSRTAVNIEQASKSKNATFSSSTISGIASVGEKDMIMKSVEDGIGRAKSYGFGMVLLGNA